MSPPVRLLKTIRLLETLEYAGRFQFYDLEYNWNAMASCFSTEKVVKPKKKNNKSSKNIKKLYRSQNHLKKSK